jgi:hypothetical protein
MDFPFASDQGPAKRSRLPSTRKATSARLTVEALEDRTVPAFLAPVPSPGGGDMPALADLNHDGRADALVISGPKSVSVSIGNGAGTFRQPVKLGGAQGTLFLVSAADRNGDGHLDILAHGRGKDVVYHPGYWPWYEGTDYTTVWLGRGDGSFGRPSTTSSFRTDGFWYPFIFNPTYRKSDFNGDGILDVAQLASQNGVGAVAVWLGNADGTEQPPRFYDAGPNPGAIAAGDINGDGWADAVVVNSLSSGKTTLSVLLNDGTW